MKVLLDTHILIWAARTPERLSGDALTLIEAEDTELFFSVASLWEIVTKAGVGRVDFQFDARVLRRALLDNGYTELPVTAEHALAVSTLPNIHRDPFDRILVAQASVEGTLLLTADSTVSQYPGPIRVV